MQETEATVDARWRAHLQRYLDIYDAIHQFYLGIIQGVPTPEVTLGAGGSYDTGQAEANLGIIDWAQAHQHFIAGDPNYVWTGYDPQGYPSPYFLVGVLISPMFGRACCQWLPTSLRMSVVTGR